jgi:hypothetical protein
MFSNLFQTVVPQVFSRNVKYFCSSIPFAFYQLAKALLIFTLFYVLWTLFEFS